jgi:hypothetical protein
MKYLNKHNRNVIIYELDINQDLLHPPIHTDPESIRY